MDKQAKLEAIRVAENVSREEFSLLTGIGLWLTGDYSLAPTSFGADCMNALFAQPRFFKYVHWFLKNETLPVIGQISPAIENSRRQYQLPASVSGYLLASRIANRLLQQAETA